MAAPNPRLLALAGILALTFAAQAAAQADTTKAPPSTTSTKPATPPPPGAKEMPAAEFDAMDGNHDGKISSSEHEVVARKMFDMMDTDGDDNVIVAEMDAAHAKMTGHAAMANEMNSAQKIKTIDTNNDGILSQGEHADGSAAMFKRMDGNSDGSLSRQEFDAGRAGMMQAGAGGG